MRLPVEVKEFEQRNFEEVKFGASKLQDNF